MGEKLMAWLRESSTQRGIVLVLSAAGIVTPAGAEVVAAAVVAVVGAVEMVMRERAG